MATTWPFLRSWRKIGIGILLLILALLVGLRLFAISPIARNMVEARLEATSVRGQTIEIDGFKGDLLGNMSVKSLKLLDANGTWLSASDVDLGWRPFAYLSDHLHLTKISAKSIDITRRPIVGPSRGGGGGVERYTLETLEMPNISLSNGVAGPAQSYTASGAVQATQRRGAIQFDLTTTSQRGDDIRADLAWGGAVPLSGTLSLNGAPNGLIATFLKAPSDAPIQLSLQSSASGTDWRFRADGSVDGVPKLTANLEISDQNYRVNGNVALDAVGLLAPLRTRLGDQAVFTARVDDERSLDASIVTDNISAELTGKVRPSLQGISIDALSLIASKIDGARLSGSNTFSLESLMAEGDVSIDQGEIRFDGLIRAPQLNYENYAATDLKAEGNWTVSSRSVTSEMRLTAESLRGLPDAIASVFGGPVSARFSGEYNRAAQQVRARTILLESGSLWALGNGSAALNGAVSFNGEARLTSVEPISSLQTTWALTGGRLNALQLRLIGSTTLSDPLDALANIVGSSIGFDISVGRTQNGVTLRSATFNSDQLNARASGSLHQGALNLRGDADISSLNLTQITADRVATNFVVKGSLSAPQLSTTTHADSWQIAGQSLNGAVVSTDIQLNRDTNFKIAAQARLLDSPLQLNLVGHRQDDRVAIESLAADWANLKAIGDATFDARSPKSSMIELDVSGTTPLGGTVAANLNFASEYLRADVAIKDVQFGTLALSETSLRMAGAWPQFEGELTYQAELPILGTPQPISGSHDLIGDAETKLLSVTGVTEIVGQSVTLTSPMTVAFGPNLGINGSVNGFGGRAQIDLDTSGQSPSALIFDEIEMATIGPLLNRPSLNGSLAGAFELGLVEDRLTGRGSAHLNGLARDAVDATATDLRLNIVIDNNQLVADLRTDHDDADSNFNISAAAPLVHRGSLLSARLADGAAVPVSIQGTGAIGPIWALAAPTNLRLVGDLMVDIDNGTGQSWRFEGPMNLSGATFEDGLTGFHLKDIAANAVLRQSGIEVQSARASGRRSGSVEASGFYHFDGASSVAMTLNRLNAFSRSDISATVSGATEIERRNRRTRITGDLDIDDARINLEQLPGAGYTTLDVVFADESNSSLETTPEREAIELNLNVDADRRIFVTGSGVDTEWGLDARITGPAGRPNVIGRATLVRGEADLLSRRFRFSDGTLQFVGDPLDTEINIRAERTNDDVTASISLSGTLNAPDIDLSSDPSLPDDEILSRVLFGRSPSELSPLEAAQLAGAAAQLAGGEAFNLIGQLQEATGLDRLDIGLNDEGAATLSTGKYIAKDIYLEIESGGTGAPGVALEWTPLDNVAVDAEVDPELGPKVAVQWKRDFDRLPGEPDDE